MKVLSFDVGLQTLSYAFIEKIREKEGSYKLADCFFLHEISCNVIGTKKTAQQKILANLMELLDENRELMMSADKIIIEQRSRPD